MREEGSKKEEGCGCRYCWLEAGVFGRTIYCILLIGISGPLSGVLFHTCEIY